MGAIILSNFVKIAQVGEGEPGIFLGRIELVSS